MFGQNFADFYALPSRCIDNPVAHESPQDLLVRVLKLAASADCKVPTWRINMMITALNRSIGCDRIAGHGKSDVLPRGSHSVSFCSEANDLVHRHSASAPGTA